MVERKQSYTRLSGNGGGALAKGHACPQQWKLRGVMNVAVEVAVLGGLSVPSAEQQRRPLTADRLRDEARAGDDEQWVGESVEEESAVRVSVKQEDDWWWSAAAGVWTRRIGVCVPLRQEQHVHLVAVLVDVQEGEEVMQGGDAVG